MDAAPNFPFVWLSEDFQETKTKLGSAARGDDLMNTQSPLIRYAIANYYNAQEGRI